MGIRRKPKYIDIIFLKYSDVTDVTSSTPKKISATTYLFLVPWSPIAPPSVLLDGSVAKVAGHGAHLNQVLHREAPPSVFQETVPGTRGKSMEILPIPGSY